MKSDSTKICISAIGCVTPLGASLSSVSSALLNRQSGIRDIKKFDVNSFGTKWAGLPVSGNFSTAPPGETASDNARPGEVRYAKLAMHSLLDDIDIHAEYNPKDVGCILGVDEPVMNIRRCIDYAVTMPLSSHDRLTLVRSYSNFFRASEFLDTDPVSVLRTVHQSYPFNGPARCHLGLCSASLQAIGMAYRTVLAGEAKAVITGGVSAKVNPTNIARLEALGAVCVDPKLDGTQRSRPFDLRRSGFVPGEGGVFFLVEREDAVRRRNGQVYARIIGYGSSLNAQHIVAPHTEQMEMRLCMTRALNDAKLNPEEIDCVNAHGSSTVLNDLHEARALSTLFIGESKPTLVATKSSHGHMIAAAGAMEILCTIAMFNQHFISPMENFSTPMGELDLPTVSSVEHRNFRNVLKNSFGMGGLAASLVLQNPN